MKKIIVLLSFGFLLSCTDNFADLNTDKKSPASVTGESLFNNGIERFYHIMHNANVNTNVFRLYAQYWSQCQYPEESQYNMGTRNIPDNWFARLYKDALQDLGTAKSLIASQQTNSQTAPIQKNKLAIITINEVQIWATLVDLFGDVPYSEALDPSNPNPKYDDAQTIYMDIIGKLDQAISDLDVNASSFASNEDLVNQGDTGMWKKAANSLKMRLALRIADVDAAKSKAMFSEALTSGVFSSVDENLSLEYIASAPYTYPAYEDLFLSGRNDYVGANTIIDIMNGLNDPRRSAYFDSNMGDGVYAGGIYGTNNNFANFSHAGTMFYTATTPGVSMSYSEVLFLMAEAAARGGYAVTESVEDLYNMAISASIVEYGGSQAMADDYLAQESVAYATAEGDWKQKIGTQKWISLYSNGLEGWTTWRQFDFTGFNVPDGLTYSDIPNRLIYPIFEARLNGTSLKAAQSAIGGDTPQTKVFWDVN